LLSSHDTKRKRVESPRWAPTDDRENLYTVRNNTVSNGQKYSYELQGKTMINELNEGERNFSIGDYERQWSASKIWTIFYWNKIK